MTTVIQKQNKSVSAILALTCTAVSLLTATLGLPNKAVASSKTLFSCSAEGVIVQVKSLNNGKLRYEAYNIPTELKRPDIALNGGLIKKHNNGDTAYTFKNGRHVYIAVKDEGYGKVLVYKDGKLIATKYCGDV